MPKKGGSGTRSSKKEVAGPYRSQSSVPKIKKKATKSEHRKVRVRPTPPPSPTRQDVEEALGKGYRKKGKFYRRSSGGDPKRVLDALRDPAEKITGPNPVREYVKDELENTAKAVKQNYDPERIGKAPTSEQVRALGTLASAVPLGKSGSVAATALSKGGERLAEKGGVKALVKRGAKAGGSRAAAKAERVRTAPARGAKAVKRAPAKVKAAPRTAKRAVTTSEGRRSAARGAARKTAQHPLASFGGASVVANQSGADIPGVKQAGAFVEGHAKALVENPGKTLETTARAIPGIVTGPAALLGSAGSSIVHGTPKPLTTELKKQGEGLVEVGEKLLSGDPKEVQKTVEDDVGLSVVAPAPALSRVRNTKAWKTPRGKLRARVAKGREETRSKRRQEAADFKVGARSKKPRKVRHAVRDSATGEERILRRTGKRIEGHRQRVLESRAAARAKAQGEREALLASAPVIKEIRKSKLSKGDHNIGDTLSTVVQYGISRDRAKADEQLAEVEASIGKVGPDEIPAETITDLANIRWLRDHPEAFDDKHFWNAVDAYKRQAKEIEHSGRKKFLAVGDVAKLPRPEERLERGVRVGGRTIATKFYRDKDTLDKKQAQLHELRQDAKIAAEGAARAKPEDRARYEAVRAKMAAEAKSLERDLKDYRAGFKQAEKDYVRDAREVVRATGRETPAYVKDIKPVQGLEGLPKFPGGRSARKQHMAMSEQSRRGNIFARDFDTLVNQSIAEPRMRRAMHRATTDFVDTWAVPVKGQRYLTSKEIERAINRGEIDQDQYAVLHSQFFKQAILDPHKGGEDFTNQLKSEIRSRANEPGHKYVVMPKEALNEFVHQMEPPKGMDKMLGGANRFLSRAILGYSPAWMVAQLVAEGIPAATAVGLNPARWARIAKYLAREERQLSQQDRATLDGTVGESAGVTPHPQTQLKPDTNLQASRFFRLSERNRLGRALLKGATGDALGTFDRWKGGKYRKIVAAAKADREVNKFTTSLSELYKGQRSISEALKGKPLKQQMEYFAKNPAEAARLERYLDDVMGNWRAMTRLEAKFAPAVIFYPFVRYSLRWMFWSFPKQHPVKATILYFLAQQNAEELEKLIGGKPQNWIDYAVPVYTGASGSNAVLPGGTRIAPGTNALITAIGSGKVEAIASGLNPAIGIGGAAIYGVDSFTGEKVAETPAEHGLLALNALLSLPAPVRYFHLNEVGDEQSVASKVFEGADPNRSARSVGFPFLPLSGDRYRGAQRFGKDLGTKYDNPVPSLPPEIWEAAYAGDWRAAQKLRRLRIRAEAAGDRVKAAEAPYFDEPGKELSKEGSEILQYITGQLVLPAPTDIKPPKKGKAKVTIGGGGGPIGGHSLGGSIGGSVGGGIGGRSIGGG